MITIDDLKDLKIYKKPCFLPLEGKDKKNKSSVILLTPNTKSSEKTMNIPYMINRLYFQSYYLEKNVNYFINSSMDVSNVDTTNESCLEELDIRDYESLFTSYHIEKSLVKDPSWDEELYYKTFEDAIKHQTSGLGLYYVYTCDKELHAILLGKISISTYTDGEVEVEWIEKKDINGDIAVSEAFKKNSPVDASYLTKHIKYNTRKAKTHIHKIDKARQNQADINVDSSTGKSKTAPESPEANGDEEGESTLKEYNITNLSNDLYLRAGDLVMFTEDAENDVYLKRLLYNDRIKQNKDQILIYKGIKERNPFIKYTYIDIAKYKGRNLFFDLSYYNQIFFKNIKLQSIQLNKKLDLYIDLLDRMISVERLKENGYRKNTVFIPVKDWDISSDTRMWMYKEDINPISAIYRMLMINPSRLLDIFKDMDVLFLSDNIYFKINFSHITDFKQAATKFKKFITNIENGSNFSAEDSDDTLDNEESKAAIVTNITDKIEKTGIDFSNDTNSEDKEELLNAIDKAASTSSNTDDTLDQIDAEDDNRIKKLLIDLASQEEESVRINTARASRMMDLKSDLLDKEIKGKTVKQILDEAEKQKDKEIKPMALPVSSINKDEWSNLKFTNFDKEYDINSDIVNMINHLSETSHPLAVRDFYVSDNSTSEDYVDLYIVNLEDYRGKRYTIKFDVPKFIDNSYLMLRGNKKTIQNQLFNMPIIKTEEDVCQIISNYQKIFVRRFGTTSGKSIQYSDKILKTLYKLPKESKIKITFGDCTKICSKYELPIDYVDIAGDINKIETPESIYYFDQDEIRNLYSEIIDKNKTEKGIPFKYNKENKTIEYYSGNAIINNNSVTIFSLYLSTLLSIEDKSGCFKDIFDKCRNASKYSYSQCSIMSTKIPLIVVCAFSEGLTTTLKKADVKYELKEKLETYDKQIMFDSIKFNDGYIVYEVDYTSSLLMNGLKDCPTDEYSLKDINSKSMYTEFLDNFGGRLKADGLENFYDCMVDPITKEILEYYKLPTDYVSILLHANILLADNKFIKHTDSTSRRLRRQELIAAKVYKALFNEAYATYANQLRHSRAAADFSIKQSSVIDKFMSDPSSSDLSVLNALNDVETKNAVTFKGENGMNSDRAYSLDKRTYDSSMLNILGMSTGFAGNVGITRQATVDMNLDNKRGYIKSIDGDLKKLNTAKTLTMTEALTPMGVTRDDPFRTAMTFIQTAKHGVPTSKADPLLVTNGADEAMPYLVSDIFSVKAKQKGQVIEISDDYIIVEYDNKEREYIDLKNVIEKNSDGGFYMNMKLDAGEKLKVGYKFKENEILAYNKSQFENSVGESDNISYKIGTLAKVAILNTDEGFEDSAIVTEKISNQMASMITVMKDKNLDKNTNVLSMIKVGDTVSEGDILLLYQDSYDDADVNALLKTLQTTEDEISELGRRSLKSPYNGRIADIKIYRTVEINELSDSLKKIVNDYEKPIKALKKKLDSNKINSNTLPATYKLPNTGKLKNLEEGVRIEIFIEYWDNLAVGDKIVYDRANKGTVKDIIPNDKSPYTDFRPNEEVSAFVNVVSLNNRMVVSPIVIGSLNKLMVELDRSVKDILEIPYDDSQI